VGLEFEVGRTRLGGNEVEGEAWGLSLEAEAVLNNRPLIIGRTNGGGSDLIRKFRGMP
jgi:hypothetical protein